jgi:hypothetical protein
MEKPPTTSRRTARSCSRDEEPRRGTAETKTKVDEALLKHGELAKKHGELASRLTEIEQKLAASARERTRPAEVKSMGERSSKARGSRVQGQGLHPRADEPRRHHQRHRHGRLQHLAGELAGVARCAFPASSRRPSGR